MGYNNNNDDNNNNNNNNNNSFITNNFGSGCKAELNLPDLDLDFSNILDESIADISMSEQDFLQIRMDTLDACSEVMSNVWTFHDLYVAEEVK